MSLWTIFGLGLTLGFVSGIALDDAYALYRAWRSEIHGGEPMPTEAARRHRSRLTIFAITSFVAVLALNAAVGFLLIVTREDAADYAACVGRWQQSFTVAYKARVEASQAVDDAMDGVVLAVSHKDNEEFQTAVRTYLALRSQQDKDRERNPLPPLPEDVCGKP